MKHEELKALMSEFLTRLRDFAEGLLALPIVLFALFFLVVTMPFWVIPYAISRWRWRE